MDGLNRCFHREILVIQSSPMTKDQHSLLETVGYLEEGRVTLNVISMCGWTEAIKVPPPALRNQSKHCTEST
jgi:hypothetical protein